MEVQEPVPTDSAIQQQPQDQVPAPVPVPAAPAQMQPHPQEAQPQAVPTPGEVQPAPSDQQPPPQQDGPPARSHSKSRSRSRSGRRSRRESRSYSRSRSRSRSRGRSRDRSRTYSRDRSRSRSYSRSDGEEESKILFIGNLPRRADERDLEEVLTDPSTARFHVERIDLKGNYAFAHVRGRNISRSLRYLNPTYLYGTRVTIEFAKSNELQKWDDRKSYSPNRTLFVVNFNPDRVGQEDIEDLFSRYGRLRRVSLRSSGRNFAFVEFEELDDAKDAKEKLDHYKFKGKSLIVRYAASAKDKLREEKLISRSRRFRDTYDRRRRTPSPFYYRDRRSW